MLDDTTPGTDMRSPYARRMETTWEELAAFHRRYGPDSTLAICEQYLATWRAPYGNGETINWEATGE